jgi:hypothetical protein
MAKGCGEAGRVCVYVYTEREKDEKEESGREVERE